jgi:hypothetical protein
VKRRGQNKLPFDEEEESATFLFKIYRTVKQTMIEANIWGAFQELGFEFDTNREPYRLGFNEENLEEVRGSRKYRRSTSLSRDCPQVANERDVDGASNLSK